MKNRFLKYNKEILSKSNLYLDFTEDEENEEIKIVDGKKKLYTTKFLNLSDSFSGRKIELNEAPILANICIFGLFDTYIDTKYPKAEGETFRKKLDIISADSNTGIIEKNFFRIFKVIRNAMTHSMDSIQIKDHSTEISYTFKGTKYYMYISDNALIMLYTAVLMLIENTIEDNRGKVFKEGLLAYYYDQIISTLIIEDDVKDIEELPRNVIRLNPKNRALITNPQYSIKDSYIRIENAAFEKSYSRDFVVMYQNEKYIIPSEVLSDSIISIDDLQKWKAL